MRTVIFVVGARPNFVKMAPVIDGVAAASDVRRVVVHTGQHYDRRMSDEIIGDLAFPEPDHFLGVGSGTHAEQTARILVGFERLLLNDRPDLVVVSGDVNSTLACALAAAKLDVPVAHVESGLRSFDWEMPEEINRVLTDRLSNLLLTHSPEAAVNLRAEGIPLDRIAYVGNTMIDTLRRLEAVATERRAWDRLGLPERGYLLATLHRPSNVDLPERLDALVVALQDLARLIPVLFPVHPRTRARLEARGALPGLAAAGVVCVEPLGYVDFLSAEIGARAILTDSGGIQEEAAALGIPCFTLRRNTERPITVELGTNTIIGDDPSAIARLSLLELARSECRIPLWDGRAGQRAAEAIASFLDPASSRSWAVGG